MKRILYVYAHPNPSSLNALLKNTARDVLLAEGHTLVESDLYAQSFNAIASWDDFGADMQSESHYFLAQQKAYQENALSPDIALEVEKIKSADHIIFQFPLWWFSVPGILKGWFDRVLVKGFAYDAGKVFETGLLKGKTTSLVVTTQSPESAYQRDGVHANVIDAFLLHMHHTLRFVGMKTCSPFVVYAAYQVDGARKEKILSEYTEHLKQLF